MAKSSRASSVKSNNQRLKKKVFGPVETARTERLSAKLLELAAQPKTPREVQMDDKVAEDAPANQSVSKKDEDDDAMDIDSSSKASKKSKVSGKKRIEKRRVKKSSIVFPSYKDRRQTRKRK